MFSKLFSLLTVTIYYSSQNIEKLNFYVCEFAWSKLHCDDREKGAVLHLLYLYLINVDKYGKIENNIFNGKGFHKDMVES